MNGKFETEIPVDLIYQGFQLKSMQLQMGNHLVFNALQSIQSYVLTHDEQELLHYISVLSSVIRHTLENISEEYIPLAKEIEYLRKYIEIEKLRHGDHLVVNMQIKVGDSRIKVPPMLIQPLIENAIQFGMLGRNDFGTVDIAVSQKQKLLLVEVTDNGVGRSIWDKKADHLRKGVEIVRERLALINEKYETDLNRIEITDLVRNEEIAGTRMILTLAV
jgi:LytS/YehU family sensor histidine kinase